MPPALFNTFTYVTYSTCKTNKTIMTFHNFYEFWIENHHIPGNKFFLFRIIKRNKTINLHKGLIHQLKDREKIWLKFFFGIEFNYFVFFILRNPGKNFFINIRQFIWCFSQVIDKVRSLQ